MAEQILITGAASELGRAFLTKALRTSLDLEIVILGWKEHKEDYQKLRKDLEAEHDLWDGQLTMHWGDVGDSVLGIKEALYEELRQTVTSIVHLAKAGQRGTDKETLVQTNVIGTENVVYFASRCPRLRLFIHQSVIGVGGIGGDALPESVSEHGRGFRTLFERSQYEAEESVRMLMAKTPTAIVRFGYLLTEEAKARLLAAARWAARLPQNPVLGDTSPMPCTSISAAVDLLTDLLRKDAAGETINAVHGQPLTGEQLWSMAFERAVGQSPGGSKSALFWSSLTKVPLIGKGNPLTANEIAGFYQGNTVETTSQWWQGRKNSSATIVTEWLDA